MTQRFHGKYKEDLLGFKDQLKLIKGMKGGSPAFSAPQGNPFTVEGRALQYAQAEDQILSDHKRFEIEIQ